MSLRDFGFFLRHIDRYSRKQQLAMLDRIGFDFYMRKGFVPHAVEILCHAASESPIGIKFNPWHDDLGRFTSGPSSGATPVSDSEQAPKSWGNSKTLEKHFKDHGEDFGVTSPKDYMGVVEVVPAIPKLKMNEKRTMILSCYE